MNIDRLFAKDLVLNNEPTLVLSNYIPRLLFSEDPKDINEAFIDLLLSEEYLHKDGYDHGFEKGVAEGKVEGFHAGYHQGAEVGAELGYYLGISENYLVITEDSKIIRSLEKLKCLISSFPRHNAEDIDILGLLDDIRTLFKKACALLKIDAAYVNANKLSF